MGVNFNDMTNPANIPHLRYIPKIVLPTVFGDAMTYLEQMGKITATVNQAIDGMNDLADNLAQEVLSTVENAKIPIYGRLIYNNSEILMPENWSLDDTKAIFEALQAGKMCILLAKANFNDDGYAVYDEHNNVVLVLTEYYATTFEGSVIIDTKFMSFTETNVRWANIEFKVTTDDVTSEVQMFNQIPIPNKEYVDELIPAIGQKVMIYKGETPISGEAGSFIELVSNGTFRDLRDMFFVDENTAVYANKISPCMTIDYRTGAIGVMKFGGTLNPWVRIYTTGFNIKSANDTAISELSTRIEAADGELANTNNDVSGLASRVQEAELDITRTESDIENIKSDYVSYNSQQKSDAQKLRARENIGALSSSRPEVYNGMELYGNSGNFVEISVEFSNGKNVLVFSGNKPIIRGVRSPENNDDCANKEYVDNAVSTYSNAVLYTQQSLSEQQKNQARNNISAVSSQYGEIYGYLSIVAIDNSNLIIELTNDGGNAVVVLGGTYANKIIRNVAMPVQQNDAANKEYVDRQVVDTSNTVRYVAQSLNSEQQSVARRNIGARSLTNNSFHGPLNLNNSSNTENEEKNIVISHYDYGTDTTGVIIHDAENGTFTLKDGSDNLMPLLIGINTDTNAAVTHGELSYSIAPIVVEINENSNSWIAHDFNRPIDLPTLVNHFKNGRTIIAKYVVRDEQNEGYANFKCCGNAIGAICEIYDATQWKRVTCNLNGTITVTALA